MILVLVLVVRVGLHRLLTPTEAFAGVLLAISEHAGFGKYGGEEMWRLSSRSRSQGSRLQLFSEVLSSQLPASHVTTGDYNLDLLYLCNHCCVLSSRLKRVSENELGSEASYLGFSGLLIWAIQGLFTYQLKPSSTNIEYSTVSIASRYDKG